MTLYQNRSEGDKMVTKPQWTDEVLPTFEGVGGKVYRIKEPDDFGSDPREQTHCPGCWFLIFAPQAHPMWSWHILMTVSLEEAEGVDPPILHYPEAAFEVSVWALDPSLEAPDPRNWPLGQEPPVMKLLQPQDAVVQFHGMTKEQLPEMMDLVASAVAEGYLVPDSDHRQRWTAVLQKTAEHYRGHPEHN
jgi:hypothetical protein